jgi:hypothetical protein
MRRMSDEPRLRNKDPTSDRAMARNRNHRGRVSWAIGLLLLTAACAEPITPVSTTAPPIPSGQARVWFYRSWEPSESLNLASIDMDGRYVGAVANGSAFYRDVLPGNYRIAPQSWARDFNQDRNVDLAPGQQVYVKIVSLTSWATGLSGLKSFERDAFYAWLIPAEVAEVEIARGRRGI